MTELHHGTVRSAKKMVGRLRPGQRICTLSKLGFNDDFPYGMPCNRAGTKHYNMAHAIEDDLVVHDDVVRDEITC